VCWDVSTGEKVRKFIAKCVAVVVEKMVTVSSVNNNSNIWLARKAKITKICARGKIGRL